jgi:hypothetical protein
MMFSCYTKCPQARNNTQVYTRIFIELIFWFLDFCFIFAYFHIRSYRWLSVQKLEIEMRRKVVSGRAKLNFHHIFGCIFHHLVLCCRQCESITVERSSRRISNESRFLCNSSCLSILLTHFTFHFRALCPFFSTPPPPPSLLFNR